MLLGACAKRGLRPGGKVADDAVREAQSRKGNFVSITVTITATSQQQLDAIYQDVTDHEDVLMAL